VREAGDLLHIRIVGLARFASDVSGELVRATVGSITILGSLQASREVKEALRDRFV